jgi:hypothetical protein
MFTQSFAVLDAAPHQQPVPSQVTVNVQRKRRATLFNGATLLMLCLTMLILAVVMVGRTSAIPPVLDLPQPYLPGNPLPRNVSCRVPGGEHIECFAELSVHVIYFTFDEETRMIKRTVVPAWEYTLGQLIAAWGTPTGINRGDYTTYVVWNTRSALLYRSSIQPENRVNFIWYDLEPAQAAPWRGFTTIRR